MKRFTTISFLIISIAAFGACGDDDGGGGGNGGAPDATAADPYQFATDAPSAYTRVDRMGMPAIATAVISSKDNYNAANPSDDANGDFVGEITSNVTALHTALDDDLTGASLTPCAAADCVGTTAPFVVPDTLQIDPAMAAGFPNGRRPQDQAMDVTLALVLLDVATPGTCGAGNCTVTTFAEIPLNPAANDVAFSTTFPYLAEPHPAQ